MPIAAILFGWLMISSAIAWCVHATEPHLSWFKSWLFVHLVLLSVVALFGFVGGAIGLIAWGLSQLHVI